MHNEWVPEGTLAKVAKRKLANFKRRHGDRPYNAMEEQVSLCMYTTWR